MSSKHYYEEDEARKQIDLAYQFSQSHIPFIVLPVLHRADFEALKEGLGERMKIINKGGLTREAHERILALEKLKIERAMAEMKSPITLDFYPDEALEVGGMQQALSQDVFKGYDEQYKFASVVRGKAQLMTHRPVEKQYSFGGKYLFLPINALVQRLEGDFENTDLIIERVEIQNE